MASPVVRNFMRQQGFVEEPSATCDMHFTGLYFQPRIVGPLVVVGILLRSPTFFFILSAILWWNVLFPALNPFEIFYNHALARSQGRTTLPPAPGPRRFAQGMAAAFMVVVAVALKEGWMVTAWVVEAGLVVAFAALLFGRFCLGAYIYHLLRGEFAFANATLPWARPSN
ncbi:MAG TPA: DUF4395 family protein [Candidatus Acidoferrales bacterium]|nr:DUF4395 family protein [Candidatus Acidoferrales bacterium]